MNVGIWLLVPLCWVPVLVAGSNNILLVQGAQVHQLESRQLHIHAEQSEAAICLSACLYVHHGKTGTHERKTQKLERETGTLERRWAVAPLQIPEPGNAPHAQEQPQKAGRCDQAAVLWHVRLHCSCRKPNRILQLTQQDQGKLLRDADLFRAAVASLLLAGAPRSRRSRGLRSPLPVLTSLPVPLPTSEEEEELQRLAQELRSGGLSATIDTGEQSFSVEIPPLASTEKAGAHGAPPHAATGR